MSLFSTMQTSISGMAAQSNALSAVGDNIANASTYGYKQVEAQFQTQLGENATAEYQSGGVIADVRQRVSQQGTLVSTQSSTDLAINGNGFFVVSQGGGEARYLTRAGSFVPDSNGNLVNAAGYQLMGYKTNPDGTPGTILSPVNVSSTALQAAASSSGSVTANLPSNAAAVTGNTAGSNQANSAYTAKTSVTVYDNLGKADVLDIYMTKTADSTWEMAVYPQSGAAAGGGGFPYSSGPMATKSLQFDPATGKLAASSDKSVSVAVPNGNNVSIDLSGMTQLAADFGVTKASANGNAPSKFDHVNVAKDGTLTAVYASGAQVQAYKIPLATVASPNNLTNRNGNAFETNIESGDMVLSAAGTGGLGTIQSDSLEQSTVDLATQLTNMIVAQRAYEANSKVLQASSDLLGVLDRINIS